MNTATAFAPGNMSGVFKIIPHDLPAKMHSLGLGFTVSDGVEVEVALGDGTVGGPGDRPTTVHFNGEPVDFPTVDHLVKQLTLEAVVVRIVSTLPLSSGFGLSGASALACAYALNALLGLGHEEESLAMMAHVAEVENLTGLGDVCAQYHGGCLVKLTPGQPLAAKPMPIAEQPIFYRYFSGIRTRDVLSDAQQASRINGAADAALTALAALSAQNSVEMNECIQVCKQFAQESGLLRDERVLGLIDDIESAGGAASMIMLGNAVFSTSRFEGCQETSLSKRRGGLVT
jgi:pantoate kinase